MGLSLFFRQFQSVNNDAHGTNFVFVPFEHFVQGSVAVVIKNVAIATNGFEYVILRQAFAGRNEGKNQAEKPVFLLDSILCACHEFSQIRE